MIRKDIKLLIEKIDDLIELAAKHEEELYIHNLRIKHIQEEINKK